MSGRNADLFDEILYWIGVALAVLGIAFAGIAIVWGMVFHARGLARTGVPTWNMVKYQKQK